MSYQDIDVTELGDLLLHEDLVVIDCRDEETRSHGQLPGVLPASDAIIQGLIRQRRANPPILVYCYHGHASRDLCAFITQFGLDRVYNLNGGWSALAQSRAGAWLDSSIHQPASHIQ